MKRRELIKNGGLAIIASAIAPSVLAQEKENDFSLEKEKIGYAILGLGFFASYVIPKIKMCEKSKVTALISNDKDKANEWKTKYNLSNCKIYNYDEFNKIKNDTSIDSIYIATPVGTHKDFALKSFEAGKHVMTEKTMAKSPKEGLQMINAAKSANKKLMVAYRARYEPFNQDCIESIKNETYGKITAITAHKGFFIGDRLGKDNWRIDKELAGGGALTDIGIYSVQACRYLTGQEPTEVFAFATKNKSKFNDLEESLSFTLKFNDNVLATGSASWNYSLQNYFRVGTTNGYLQLEPATSNTNLRMIVKQENPTIIGEKYLRNIDQIPAMFDHFSDCILNNKEPKTNGEEGLKDLKVIQALYESVEKNRPIHL